MSCARIIVFAFFFLACQTGFLLAQDAHFTQIQNLPLQINPAHTGLYSEYDYRVGADYRLQKTPSGSAYNTFVGWADVHMQPLYNGGWFGVGLSATRDNTSGSILVLNRYVLSLAYHQVIGENAILSTGLAGAYVDRSLDHSKLVFGDQFDGTNFSQNVPTADVFFYPHSRFWTLEPAINLEYSFYDNSQLSVGFAMDNVNRPRTSFLYGDAKKRSELAVNSQGLYTVPLRYHVNLNYKRQIAENMTWNIYTYFSYQNQARQNLIGTEISYDFISGMQKVLSISGGMMYRINRSANMLLGLETKHIKLGISYDLSITRTAGFFDNYSSFEVACIFHSVFPKSNRARNRLKRTVRCVDNFSY